MTNHPSILAFGYSYLPEKGAEPSYDIVNAVDLAHFQVITLKEIDVTLLDVSHVGSDGTTITDIIWDRNPTPYTDTWATAGKQRMNRKELEPFVYEAQNIVNGYTFPLPDGVSIDCAQDVIPASSRPTVNENKDSVSVLAWVTIPKDYFITNAPATAGDTQ